MMKCDDKCPECGERMENMTGGMHFCPPEPRYVEAGLAAMLRNVYLDWTLRVNRGEWPAGSAPA